MAVFLSTLNQIAFLFTLIGAGYVLAKLGVLPEGAAKVLAKLENTIGMAVIGCTWLMS